MDFGKWWKRLEMLPKAMFALLAAAFALWAVGTGWLFDWTNDGTPWGHSLPLLGQLALLCLIAALIIAAILFIQCAWPEKNPAQKLRFDGKARRAQMRRG